MATIVGAPAAAANGVNGTHAAPSTNDMRLYAAPSLSQPHRARDAIRDAHAGKIAPLCGYFSSVSSVDYSRVIATLGFDFVWLDWEHSGCNTETLTAMIHNYQYMSGGRTMPFVRVPGSDHDSIGFAMDAGASIVVPQVETVEQAKHICSAAKYGVKQGGTRSAPPFRLIPGFTDMPIDKTRTLHQNLNDQAAIVIQIESLQGIKNLDAILTACPDIDVVWLGRLDTRISMDLPANGGEGGDEPEWKEALDEFYSVLKKHDKPHGGFAFPPPVRSEAMFNDHASKQSFSCVTSDYIMLMWLRRQLDIARGLMPAEPKTLNK